MFKRGVTINGQVRQIIVNLRSFFDEEKKNNGFVIPVNRVVDRLVKATKISQSTIVSVCKQATTLQLTKGKENYEPLPSDDQLTVNMSTNEIIPCKSCGKKRRRRHRHKKPRVQSENIQVETPPLNTLGLRSPGRKRSRKSVKTEVDDFGKDAIRRHIYSYYARKEFPTLRKLRQSLKDADLFNGGITSLSIVLRKCGFQWKKYDSRKVLMERPDIQVKRFQFLTEISKHNKEDIIWLDETWVNSNHSKETGWTDDSKESTIGTPMGKGGRLILLHAGTYHGFVPQSMVLFQSRKTGDYHEEMDGDRFEKWFTNVLLKNIKPKSVIVLDNASYHSRQINKAPTQKTKKDDIIEWLETNKIPYPKKNVKPTLLQIVKEHRSKLIKYVIDEAAKQQGHTVVRLPPYHCIYNPIELIWAQVKGHVAKNNTLFTMSHVEELTREAIAKIKADSWKDCVDHCMIIIKEAMEMDQSVEIQVEEMIIPLNEETTSEEGSEIDEPCSISYSDEESEMSSTSYSSDTE